jgi:Phytanoyl-CoA dioxygenase (PhyH)
MTATAANVAEVLADVDRLVDDRRALEAIEVLRGAVRDNRDERYETRLAEVRYAAFRELRPASRFERWPAANDRLDEPTRTIPEVTRAELTPEVVRRHMLSQGSVMVHGLLDETQVDTFVTGIDQALATRNDPGRRRDDPWYRMLPLPSAEAASLGRRWVAASGGVPAADSPRLLHTLFETYDAIGLRDIVAAYLGERPVLSANKCTMRRVPLSSNTNWHQDGAFLGKGIRALNVWVTLTDCGVDAPGLDVVPRRFDHVLETGTGGSYFDWAVGPETVERVAAQTPVMRPQFRAGDALLFDDLFLHRTAIEPSMSRERHAIEAWFFAPTDYPTGQVPLVW